MRLSRIILVIVFMAAFITGFVFVNNKLQQVKLTIEFNHIESVVILKVDDNKTVKTVINSGEITSLDKGTYLLSYKGTEGYTSDELSIDLKSDKKVIINPYYSDSRLESLLEDQQEQITQVLAEKYPHINLYRLEGRLYHFGGWYGAKLVYTGSDAFNSDSLRVVLQNKNGVWQVVTDPPNISLSKFIYKSVPRDILKSVNNL